MSDLITRPLPGGGTIEFPDGFTDEQANEFISAVEAINRRPASWLDREPANVFEAVARAMVELPGIGKSGTAAPAQGGYSYRGIEDITAAGQAVLGRLGVVTVPVIVGDPKIREFLMNGNPWTETTMRIKYRFVHGPSMTEFTAGGDDGFVAMARDNSDKGANKCMTQAYKYALIQTLMIGDKNDDVDGQTAVADAKQPEFWEQFGYANDEDYQDWKAKLNIAYGQLNPDEQELAKDFLKSEGESRRWPIPATVAEAFMDRITAIVRGDGETESEAPAAEKQPDSIPADKPPAEEERAAAQITADEEQARAEDSRPDPSTEDQTEEGKVRSPSLAQLEAFGVKSFEIDMASEQTAAMTNRIVGQQLNERNMHIGGTPKERAERLRNMIAYEIAIQRQATEPSTDPIPIAQAEGELATGQGDGGDLSESHAEPEMFLGPDGKMHPSNDGTGEF